MPKPNPKSSALRVSSVALPLLLVLSGCGSSSSDSQIGSYGVTPTGNAGAQTMLNLPPGNGSAGAASATGGAGSVTDPGPYMLPPDFTAATLGGFKLGSAIDPGATGGAGAPSVGGGTGCGTSILGVVRDFKGMNEPDGHPDFEHFQGDDASLGIVKDALGDDQKPVYNGTGPIIDPNYGQQTTDKMHYDEWYRATANVNKPYVIYFYFQPNNGVLTFQSNAFFPLDGAGWGNTCHEPDAVHGTDPKKDLCTPQAHNFGFTTELHTQFNYKGGETFSFTGDDDLWVFINKKLAIDLGGLHKSQSRTVSLDMAAAKLGITVGNTYDLDLFHAERHTEASNFRVDTNLAFTNCGTIVEEPPVK